MTPIYHRVVSEKVCSISKKDANFSIESLNNKLTNDYLNYINAIVLDLYKTRYLQYYVSALLPYTQKCVFKNQFLNWIVRVVIGRKTNCLGEQLLLLHNIRIESHRFCVQRALALLG